MNTSGTMAMLTDKDEKTGEYKIPRIIYSDAFYSEMVPYADLILARHDLSRALGLHFAARPPDQPVPTGRRRHPPACGRAGSRRAPIPGRADRARWPPRADPLGTNEDGGAKYPGGYKDYIVNHERAPGIGTLAGWRGANGTQDGRGEPNPNQLDALHRKWLLLAPRTAARGTATTAIQHGGYLRYAFDMGFDHAHRADHPADSIARPLQKFRLAAKGRGGPKPPEEHRARVETYFDPLPFWYPPFDDNARRCRKSTFSRHHPAPGGDVSQSWGSQNAWLRQIHGQNRLFINRATAAKLGLADDDWVWIENSRGRVKGQIKCMEGCNPDTVWTWNAIGKRKGSWNLDPEATEATKGFLLNHLITELLPAKDGTAYSNSDPITGQAAWFDLKVRLVKALPEEAGESAPQFDILPRLQKELVS